MSKRVEKSKAKNQKLEEFKGPKVDETLVIGKILK
jgi:hypothetical protein